MARLTECAAAKQLSKYQDVVKDLQLAMFSPFTGGNRFLISGADNASVGLPTVQDVVVGVAASALSSLLQVTKTTPPDHTCS